jgi:transcriptional regulator ATRX
MRTRRVKNGEEIIFFALLQIQMLCVFISSLIFSAFVAVLNIVEHFMHMIDKHGRGELADAENLGVSDFQGPWKAGDHYYRLDGKTPKQLRHAMIKKFNDPTNIKTK